MSVAGVFRATWLIISDLEVPSSEEKRPSFKGLTLVNGPFEVGSAGGRLVGEKIGSDRLDKASFWQVVSVWEALCTGGGMRKLRDVTPSWMIGAESGKSKGLETPLLDTLPKKVAGVKLEAMGDSLDASVELRVVAVKVEAEMKGS